MEAGEKQVPYLIDFIWLLGMPEFPDVRQWKNRGIACEPTQRMQDPQAFLPSIMQKRKKKSGEFIVYSKSRIKTKISIIIPLISPLP